MFTPVFALVKRSPEKRAIRLYDQRQIHLSKKIFFSTESKINASAAIRNIWIQIYTASKMH